MKTKSIIALAVPVGIAKAFLTAKLFYILGIIVMWLLTGAVAHAGEYTDGRAGENRGSTRNLESNARAFNDTMSYLSNNQQFLNGVLAYSRSDTSTGSGQALLEAMRNAAGNAAAREAARPSESGAMPGDLIWGSPIIMGPLSGSSGASTCRWGTEKIY